MIVGRSIIIGMPESTRDVIMLVQLGQHLFYMLATSRTNLILASTEDRELTAGTSVYILNGIAWLFAPTSTTESLDTQPC